MNDVVSFGRIFDESLRLAFTHWRPVLPIIAGTTAAYTFADVAGDVDIGNAIYTVGGLVMLYLQLFLVVRMARGEGLLAGREHETGSPTLGLYFRAFGQSLLYIAGVGVGLLVLVLPGIWLATIWFIVLPIMVVENRPLTECFGESKKMVERNFGPVLLMVLLVGIGIFGCSTLLVYLVPIPTTDDLASLLFLNFLIQTMLVFGWISALAVYACLAGKDGGRTVNEVFA